MPLTPALSQRSACSQGLHILACIVRKAPTSQAILVCYGTVANTDREQLVNVLCGEGCSASVGAVATAQAASGVQVVNTSNLVNPGLPRGVSYAQYAEGFFAMSHSNRRGATYFTRVRALRRKKGKLNLLSRQNHTGFVARTGWALTRCLFL